MFRKLAIILALCSVSVLLLAACGTARDSSSSSTPTGNVVNMNDTQFVQSSITIKKGESITFTSDTISPHIIANGTWEQSKAQAGAEPGAPQIKDVQVAGNSSQTIGPFATAGTFKLYCTIHAGMNLTVQVV